MTNVQLGMSTTEINNNIRREVRDQVALIREQLSATNGGGGANQGGSRPIFHQKDLMPETLGNQYRDKWRTWAYKARDCLAQMDPGLQETLEAVESQSTELTPEYIQSLNISPEVNAAIKRFLVHKLDGDPAEVVRNASKKHGLEQYRLLAQLCDPTVSGRN